MSSTVRPLRPSGMGKILTTDRLLVLEFTAPWSEPCKFMKPKLSELASGKSDKADFYELDINEFKQLADRLRVEVLPTFLLVHKCWVKKRVVGVDKNDLANAIDNVHEAFVKPKSTPSSSNK